VTARLPLLIPARVESLGPDRCRVHLGSDSLAQLVQDVVALGPGAEIEGPAEVVAHLHAVGSRLLAAGTA
jgi:hypothetical protein